MCRTVAILHLLSIIGLPPTVWFALDARIARLNPWIWAVVGFLSVTAPCIVIFGVLGFVREEWLLGLLSERVWKFLIVPTPLAGGWFTAFVIHKWVLKPKRVASIGTSLNYVGGWLGTLLFQMVFSAGADLAFYASNGYRTLAQLCPGVRREVLKVIDGISITPGAQETGLMILGVVGLSWAAIALIRKSPSAIRLTGCVLLVFRVVHFWQFLDVGITAAPRSPSTKRQRHGPVPVGLIWYAFWLGYLSQSRRVREVYGRNFWGSYDSPIGG